MYPLPCFLYKVIRMLADVAPHTFTSVQGLLTNSVSILVGHAIARIKKDAKTANQQVKYLALAARLLTMVKADL